MHADVVQDHAGSRPICGMALEPRIVQLDPDENLLRVPIFVLGMSE